jgi:catalase
VLVPGAFRYLFLIASSGFSPDKMLQGRLFSYGDTQRYRLGVNFNHIPVNAPKCPFLSYHRDGAMRTDGNLGATTHYWPNSKGAWMDRNEALIEPPLPIEGDATYWDHRVDDDHYEQPGILFRKMSPKQQRLLFENTARAMDDARIEVKQRHIANCTKADPAYGAGVAAALGLKPDAGMPPRQPSPQAPSSPRREEMDAQFDNNSRKSQRAS